MSSAVNITTKIALPKVLEGIHRTLEAYEDGVYDDKALDEVMGDLLVDLGNSVDRRISLLDYLGESSVGSKPGSGIIGKAQDLYRIYRDKMETAIKLRDRIKENTLSIVEANKDIVFKGNLGKLASQNNSSAKLICDIPLASKTLSNLLEPNNLDFLDIPAEYIKAVTVMQLDVEKLKHDLSFGKEVPFARLEKGTHLRIRR